jgi:HK97 family phage portal protein
MLMWPFKTKQSEPPPLSLEGQARPGRTSSGLPAISPQNATWGAPSSLENPSTDLTYALTAGFGDNFVPTGQVVNEKTAIRSTTVYRCVSLISGLIASIPMSVYERTPDGRRTATEHRIYPLLHDVPNDLMGSFTWRELIGVDLLLGGNHYSLIERDNANRVVGFLPLVRAAVTPYRAGGETRYALRTDQGDVPIRAEDILHVPGLGFDGLMGLSPIGMVGKSPVGLDLTLSEYQARVHANGATPSGLLSVNQKISPEGFKRLRAQFDRDHTGVMNAGKPIIADEGTSWATMQMSPQDAQTLDTRRFQVTDICRLFGVPPHMVGEQDRSTTWGSGLEQQSLGFLRYTLEPWLKRIEDELYRKLFFNARAPGSSNFYAEFDRDALLAMDSAAQAAAFSSGIQNGYFKPSEVRKWKNLPPAEGADQLFVNSTLVPISMAGTKTAGGSNDGAPAPSLESTP